MDIEAVLCRGSVSVTLTQKNVEEKGSEGDPKDITINTDGTFVVLNRPSSSSPSTFRVDDAFENKEQTLPAIRSLVAGLFEGKSASIFCSNHLYLPERGSFSPTLGLALIELSEEMVRRRRHARVKISVTSFELFSGEIYDLLSPIGGGALEVKVRWNRETEGG